MKGSTRAIWNGLVIAESTDVVIRDGIHHFPSHTVNSDFLTPSGPPTSHEAVAVNYYTLVAGDRRADAAAWQYPDPHLPAPELSGRIGFRSDVEITTAKGRFRSRLIDLISTSTWCGCAATPLTARTAPVDQQSAQRTPSEVC